jgi:hypothetical protein
VIHRYLLVWKDELSHSDVNAHEKKTENVGWLFRIPVIYHADEQEQKNRIYNKSLDDGPE